VSLVLAVLSAVLSLVTADIVIDPKGGASFTIPSLQAQFGPSLTSDGFMGTLVVLQGNELYACEPLKSNNNNESNTIAVIERGPPPSKRSNDAILDDGLCTFSEKVLSAQKAGYDAVVVFDNIPGEHMTTMAGDDDSITIPSIFVTYEGGQALLAHGGQLALMLPDEEEYFLFPNLYTIVVVGSGLLFLCSLFVCYRRYRASRYNEEYDDTPLVRPSPGGSEAGRLSSSDVKNLPKRPYNVSLDATDSCCICLEDYVADDILIILPCTHKYHQPCLEPWLESRNRHCPMCKRDPSKTAPMPTAIDMSESSPLLVNGAPPSTMVQHHSEI
jgi:E3 ubiquitin-protein ligase RNF13